MAKKHWLDKHWDLTHPKEEKKKDMAKKMPDHQGRLEYLRKQIKKQNISYGEIAELQSLKKHIKPGDVELREWAGIKEK